MRELLIHIGDPKCGSTSIQHALYRRACSSPGIRIVPQPDRNASGLANCLRPSEACPSRRAQRRARQFARARAWAADSSGDLGILSAEFFSLVPPAELQSALEEFLPAQAGTARIVSYLRPHASRVLSAYAQRVKAGACLGPLDAFIKELTDKPLLHYAPRVQRWRGVFGPRLILRPFIKAELAGGDVVRDFFSTALQGAPFSLADTPAANPSLFLEELSGLQLVQRRLYENEVPAFLRQSLGGAVGRALQRDGRRLGTPLVLNTRQAEAIRSAFCGDAADADREIWHRGLMVPALDETAARAPAVAPVLDAGAFFGPSERTRLTELADRVSALVKARPHAWRRDYQYSRGQRSRRPAEGPRRDNADRVWEAVGSLAGALGNPSALAGG